MVDVPSRVNLTQDLFEVTGRRDKCLKHVCPGAADSFSEIVHLLPNTVIGYQIASVWTNLQNFPCIFLTMKMKEKYLTEGKKNLEIAPCRKKSVGASKQDSVFTHDQQTKQIIFLTRENTNSIWLDISSYSNRHSAIDSNTQYPVYMIS